MRNDFLLHSNLTPFFWAKLLAPALLIGALGSGCSAGVDGAPKFDDPVAPTTQTPASNTTQNPRPARSRETGPPQQGVGGLVVSLASLVQKNR